MEGPEGQTKASAFMNGPTLGLPSLSQRIVVNLIRAHPRGLLFFGMILLGVIFHFGKILERMFRVPLMARLLLVILVIIFVFYYNDFLLGLNGGNNPFAEKDSGIIFGLLFYEYGVISFLLVTAVVVLVFGKKK